MTARILRAADYRRMAWRNGGGETWEIAAGPEGVGLDAFDWRVSMARVATEGPFSLFPGIDRTLCLIDGEAMDLTIGAAAPLRVTMASAPLPFPADVATMAHLPGGPIRDLNVMTRRGRCVHRVERLAVEAPLRVTAGSGPRLFLCLAGRLAVDEADHLEAADTLLVAPGEDSGLAPLVAGSWGHAITIETVRL